MENSVAETYQDCEFLLISALLYAPNHWAKAAEIIHPEYFYDEENRKIWEAMSELKTFDSRAIIKRLEGVVDFKTVMAREGLSIDRIITAFEVNKLCWLVVEAYKRTEINRVKESITADNLKELSAKIVQISQIGDIAAPADVANEYAAKIDRLGRREPDSRIISTGFKSIDAVIEGLKKSELVILGGRPGSGKTTLAMNMAFNIARKHKNVLFFSLEMSAAELHDRLVSSIAEIKPYPGIDFRQAEKLLNVSRKVEETLPLKIDDRASLTVEGIYLEAKKAKEAGKLDLIVIDHMSILKSRKAFKSRYEEISDISRQLKVIAKEMDVPVLCLCQLNRGVEGREVKAPNMSDLRDSGSIEQDADLILFVYRPEYHIKQRQPENPNSQEYFRWEEELNSVKGKAQVVVSKNRRGETGSVPLAFEGKYSKFREAI